MASCESIVLKVPHDLSCRSCGRNVAGACGRTQCDAESHARFECIECRAIRKIVREELERALAKGWFNYGIQRSTEYWP